MTPPGAAGPRVLLVDDLDAMGADWADAHERASWLKAAGARVTWVALVSQEGVPPAGKRETFHVLPRIPTSLRRVRTLARSGRFELVVVAAAEQGGGPVGVALSAGSRARWWPTGLAGPPATGLDALRRGLFGGPGLPALDGSAALGAGLRFGWSAADLSRRPGRSLPLWDGDLALVPEGFGGRSGSRLLAAFASMADEWSGVDLVAWTDPRAEASRRAAGLDIGTRVHHVGPPRRMAEWAWWSQASLAVLRGAVPLSAGLVLRALAAGCPLLWVAPEPAVEGCARWMEEQGTAFVTGDDPDAIAAALARVLAKGDEVERVIVRGRALAAAMHPHGVMERLSACLGAVPASRKRAA